MRGAIYVGKQLSEAKPKISTVLNRLPDASTVTISHSVSESRINESGVVDGGDGNSVEVCSSLPDFRTSHSFDEFMNNDSGTYVSR